MPHDGAPSYRGNHPGGFQNVGFTKINVHLLIYLMQIKALKDMLEAVNG